MKQAPSVESLTEATASDAPVLAEPVLPLSNACPLTLAGTVLGTLQAARPARPARSDRPLRPLSSRDGPLDHTRRW